MQSSKEQQGEIESLPQCKEKEENNRMGKTRDLFKKIRDTKGTFHAKMGTIKDRLPYDPAISFQGIYPENICPPT